MKAPTFKILHPNARHTGSSIEMTLHPAHDDVSGYIDLVLKPQGEGTPFTFDDDKAIRTRLFFDDVCNFLAVFRGYHESIVDGGLFHAMENRCVKINLSHQIDPDCTYILQVTERPKYTMQERTIRFSISSIESIGICGALEGVLSALVLGYPCIEIDK